MVYPAPDGQVPHKLDYPETYCKYNKLLVGADTEPHAQ